MGLSYTGCLFARNLITRCCLPLSRVCLFFGVTDGRTRFDFSGTRPTQRGRKRALAHPYLLHPSGPPSLPRSNRHKMLNFIPELLPNVPQKPQRHPGNAGTLSVCRDTNTLQIDYLDRKPPTRFLVDYTRLKSAVFLWRLGPD